MILLNKMGLREDFKKPKPLKDFLFKQEIGPMFCREFFRWHTFGKITLGNKVDITHGITFLAISQEI